MAFKIISCSLVFENSKSFIAIMLQQFSFAGMNILIVVALNGGMNHFVLGVYRHAIATIVMAPFAFFLERKKQPKLSFSFLCQISALGMFGPVLAQNCYYLGLKYTSPTYTTALLTAVPAITFVMAVVLGMEKINLRDVHNGAKIAGTLLSLSGALLLTLYKGPALHMLWTGSIHKGKNIRFAQDGSKDWTKGSLLLVATCFLDSAFYIVQTRVVKRYRAQLSITTWICLVGTLQSLAVTFVFERDLSVWALGWDLKLLTVVYAGVVSTGIVYFLQAFCLALKGPVFVTAFSPLRLVIVASMGSIILGETIHLGSVLGGVVTVVGLYGVLWGKLKDHKAISTQTEAVDGLHNSQWENVEVKLNNEAQEAESLHQIIQVTQIQDNTK